MSDLPRGTILGELRLGRVLEYYDFPRLFVCQSATGQNYVAVSTFDDDEEFHWLYLPVSSLRLDSVMRGGISLRESFHAPEGGYLVRVISYGSERRPDVSFVLPEQVPEDDLPSTDYSIALDPPQPSIDTSLSPQQVASATRRETFDYRIYPDLPNLHEVPARKLGGILTSTQELLDALGQASQGEPTVRGAIPADLLQKTRVNVSHSFPGSFGVQFRSAQFSDLLGHSVLAAAVRELANLLLAQDSADMLSNKLHSLRGRVASKYRRLLKELADINSGIDLNWGSVESGGGGRFHLTAAQVRSAYAIVDRIDIAMAEEVTVTGKLVGFNSRTKRYEILSGDDGRTYAGRLADDARLEVANPAIGQFYEADIRMLVETQSSSGDELIRWVLVRLGPSRTASAA